MSGDLLVPVSLSSSTPLPGEVRNLWVVDLIFALQGLKYGVLLSSRRALPQRSVLWRPPKAMGDCDLCNEGSTSLCGKTTYGTECIALTETL